MLQTIFTHSHIKMNNWIQSFRPESFVVKGTILIPVDIAVGTLGLENNLSRCQIARLLEADKTSKLRREE